MYAVLYGCILAMRNTASTQNLCTHTCLRSVVMHMYLHFELLICGHVVLTWTKGLYVYSTEYSICMGFVIQYGSTVYIRMAIGCPALYHT